MSPFCSSCARPIPSLGEAARFCPYCGTRQPESTFTPSTPVPVGELSATADHTPDTVRPPSSATMPRSSAFGPDIPEVIGGYTIVAELGSGGMGQVFEARSPAGETVAIKLLASRLSSSTISIERFRQEGRLASQISHPRCVFVYAADSENGRPYIVMEKMPGRTLKDLLDERGPLPPQEAIRHILDAIEGLQQAHRLGVIHRDVKPSNCFLTEDGRIKIGDFGLSKSLHTSAELSSTGAYIGTVLYSSPEQVRGDGVDYASDVYSLCVTMFQLLTGRTPFQHENPTAVLAKIISEDAPDIRSIRPEIPASLARVIMRGLQRDRVNRWQNLGEMRLALEAMIPARLSIGGVGTRMAAWILDQILLAVVGIALFNPSLETDNPGLMILIRLSVGIVWFAILDGWWGTSPGKWLFRLRVCRTGTTEPPGLGRGLLRSLAFNLLMTVVTTQLSVAYREFRSGPVSLPDVLWWLIPFLIGAGVLILPMRRSNNFLGMHEKLSGTCVLRLPARPAFVQLTSRQGDPFQTVPPRTDDTPAHIGPYGIRRAARTNHGLVLLGEDELLGRRVMLRLIDAASDHSKKHRKDNGRPARLRPLGHGTIHPESGNRNWEAFVAPDGSPLADVVTPRQPLDWSQTRPILEQLADELHHAHNDKSLPAGLSVEMVWVRTDGQLRLLDFPLSKTETVGDSISLIREVARLALEGEPEAADRNRTVAAAVPRYASRFLERTLPSRRRFADISACRESLLSMREMPTTVTRAMRLLQLAVHAFFVAIPLLLLVGMTTLIAVNPELHDEQLARFRSESRKWTAITLAGLPLVWALWSFAFRGGVAFYLTGLALVSQSDGQLPPRRVYILRTLAVWLPMFLPMLVLVLLSPTEMVGHPPMNDVLMDLSALVPFVWLLLALALPRRGLLDRWLGLTLVPA